MHSKSVRLFLLGAFGFLFSFHAHGQNWSFGAGLTVSPEKTLPELLVEKQLNDRNFLQLSYAGGVFSKFRYPEQVFGQECVAGGGNFLRECSWQVPYGEYEQLWSRISGHRIALNYINYLGALRIRRHRPFWSLQLSYQSLEDQYIYAYRGEEGTGVFSLSSLGCSAKGGYRYVGSQFWVSAAVGPSFYFPFFEEVIPDYQYTSTAPFVATEFEVQLSVAYYLR